MRPKKPCGQPGCAELIEGGSYCGKHKRQASKAYDRERGNSNERGYGWKWQKYRAWFLSRHPLCVDCETQGRATAATEVHETDYTRRFDKDTTMALCKSCHSKRSNAGETKSNAIARYVVTGPPGAGKTTWVEQRRKSGDVVFDMDALCDAMAQVPRYPRPAHIAELMLDIRAVVVKWLERHRNVSAFVIVENVDKAREIACCVAAELVNMRHPG